MYEPGRHYRLPTEADYAAVRRAQERVAGLLEGWEFGGRQAPYPVPDESTPAGGGSGAGRAFSVQRYGMLQWADLFTARQKAALVTIGRACRLIGDSDHIAECMALLMSGVIDRNVALATWRPQADQDKVEHLFAKQALPMAWDFGEAVPLSSSTGSFDDRLQMINRTITASCAVSTGVGQMRTVSVGLALLSESTEQAPEHHLMMAVSTIFIIVPIVIFLMFQRYFRQMGEGGLDTVSIK